MGGVSHEEIPEDHLVLFHFTWLLHELDGGDVLQEGGNFQGFPYVGPLVVTGDHFEVGLPS